MEAPLRAPSAPRVRRTATPRYARLDADQRPRHRRTGVQNECQANEFRSFSISASRPRAPSSSKHTSQHLKESTTYDLDSSARRAFQTRQPSAPPTALLPHWSVPRYRQTVGRRRFRSLLSNRCEGISQKGKKFISRVLAIPVVSTVYFRNDDDLYHNVFSLSRPNEFELGLCRKGISRIKTFNSPGRGEFALQYPLFHVRLPIRG